MRNPPLIAWDVDDVLNELTREWLEEFSEGRSGVPPCERLSSNPPHELLGISKEEYLASLDSFRARRMRELKPSPEVFEWFKRSGSSARHFALSAVPLKFAGLSAEWTLSNFGRWFGGFAFVPSKRPDDAHFRFESGKGDMLAGTLHADIFIDDNMENARAAEKAGVRSLLFPAPWNEKRGMSAVEFLNELDEILKRIDRQI